MDTTANTDNSTNNTADLIEHKLMSDTDGDVWSCFSDQIHERTATVGEEMCKLFLIVYYRDISRNTPITTYAVNLMSGLLGVSPSAKAFALKAGILWVFAKDIGQVHATLCMEGLDMTHFDGDAAEISQASNDTRTLVTSSVRSPLLSRLRTSLRLLANLLHASVSARTAARRHGVVKVLEPLWSACLLSEDTLRLLLEVLCNYIANNAEATKSMAVPFSNKRSLAVSVTKFGCKLLRTKGKGLVRSISFDLLTSMVASSECRRVLWKEGFIEECVTKLTISKRARDPFLLKFLAMASHYKEVQHALLRTSTPLNMLVMDIMASSSTPPQHSAFICLYALCTLRNLCFSRPAYQMISRHKTCMSILINLCKPHSETDAEIHYCKLAMEALTALLDKCNKTEKKLLEPRLTPLLQRISAPLTSLHLNNTSTILA